MAKKYPEKYIKREEEEFIDPLKPEFRRSTKKDFVMPLSKRQTFGVQLRPGSKLIRTPAKDYRNEGTFPPEAFAEGIITNKLTIGESYVTLDPKNGIVIGRKPHEKGGYLQLHHTGIYGKYNNENHYVLLLEPASVVEASGKERILYPGSTIIGKPNKGHLLWDSEYEKLEVLGDIYADKITALSGVIGGWTIKEHELASKGDHIVLHAGSEVEDPRIRVYSYRTSNPEDYAELIADDIIQSPPGEGVPRLKIFRDGVVRNEYGKIMWFQTKHQAERWYDRVYSQFYTKDGKEFQEEFGIHSGILNEDGISIWSLSAKSPDDPFSYVKSGIALFAPSHATASGACTGGIQFLVEGVSGNRDNFTRLGTGWDDPFGVGEPHVAFKESHIYRMHANWIYSEGACLSGSKPLIALQSGGPTFIAPVFLEKPLYAGYNYLREVAVPSGDFDAANKWYVDNYSSSLWRLFDSSLYPESSLYNLALGTDDALYNKLRVKGNFLLEGSQKILEGSFTSQSPYMGLIGWGARIAVEIDNSTNSETLQNFLTDVTIFYDSDMNNDFSDIRFTDSDGSTILKYGWDWADDGTEIKVDGSVARAVVEVPLILPYSKKTIFVYFKNPGASSTADLEGLSSATNGNWFDHFTSDRSDEYNNIGIGYDNVGWTWDTVNSQLVAVSLPDVSKYYIVSPKNLSIKNFLCRVRIQGIYRGRGQAECGIEYRYTDDDNKWKLNGPTDRQYNPSSIEDETVRWKKIISGVQSIKEDWLESPWAVMTHATNNWATWKISTFENNHLVDIEVLDRYTSSWGNREHFYSAESSSVDNDQNVAGQIRIKHNIGEYKFPNAYVDYLYIRQNTKPFPTVITGVKQISGGDITYNLDSLTGIVWNKKLSLSSEFDPYSINFLGNERLKVRGDFALNGNQLLTGGIFRAGSLPFGLPNWNYRRPVRIDNSSNSKTLSSFCVDVQVNYDAHMNNDFSDIRFTDADGISLLDFGIDLNDDGTKKKVNGNSATFVVKIPFIYPNIFKTIYMYYGNPSASSTADLEALSSASEGNWFDHFISNRSSEYTYTSFQWDTGNSIIKGTGLGDASYIYPTGLELKNLIAKTRIQRAIGGGNSYTFQTRVSNNNYWFISAVISRIASADPNFGFVLNGTPTNVLAGTDDLLNDEWYLYQFNLYDTDIYMHFEGSGSDETYDETNPNVSDAGYAKIIFGDNAVRGQVDYLYIRQNTKPFPTTSVEDEQEAGSYTILMDSATGDIKAGKLSLGCTDFPGSYTLKVKGSIALINLRTSDPHLIDELWNDSGTVAISSG